MTDYRPIDCSLHDRMEAAAVLRTPVRLTWRVGEGMQNGEGRITDILVRDGAEYLILEGCAEVRLDRIETFEDGSDDP